MHHHEADVHICRFATVKGHPLLQFPCSINMLDDFFCVRLMCILLDMCGMCFNSRLQKRKLDSFPIFQVVPSPFLMKPVNDQYTQYYLLCRELMPMDIEFMVTDSLKATQPKVALLKNINDAVNAIDEMFTSAIQGSGYGYPHFQFIHMILTLFLACTGEGRGDDSGNKDECPTNDDEDNEDVDDISTVNSLVGHSHLTESLLSFFLSSLMSATHLLQNQHSSLHYL